MISKDIPTPLSEVSNFGRLCLEFATPVGAVFEIAFALVELQSPAIANSKSETSISGE